jgi:hypothetical protein
MVKWYCVLKNKTQRQLQALCGRKPVGEEPPQLLPLPTHYLARTQVVVLAFLCVRRWRGKVGRKEKGKEERGKKERREEGGKGRKERERKGGKIREGKRDGGKEKGKRNSEKGKEERREEGGKGAKRSPVKALLFW